MCVCVCQLIEEQSREEKNLDVKDESGEKSSPIPVDSSKPAEHLTVTVSGEEADGEKSLELAGTSASSPGLLGITISGKEADEDEVQRHKSSASTLNDLSPPLALANVQEVELHKVEQEGPQAAALATGQGQDASVMEEEEGKCDQVGPSC